MEVYSKDVYMCHYVIVESYGGLKSYIMKHKSWTGLNTCSSVPYCPILKHKLNFWKIHILELLTNVCPMRIIPFFHWSWDSTIGLETFDPNLFQEYFCITVCQSEIQGISQLKSQTWKKLRLERNVSKEMVRRLRSSRDIRRRCQQPHLKVWKYESMKVRV